MPAGIPIIRPAAHTVIVPVPGQRLPQLTEITVLGQERAPGHAVIPGTQLLALHIRVVALPVVGVLVLVPGSPVG